MSDPDPDVYSVPDAEPKEELDPVLHPDPDPVLHPEPDAKLDPDVVIHYIRVKKKCFHNFDFMGIKRRSILRRFQ
jgi:hypothetical protein